MTLADILRAGKARIIERGWCQGDWAALYATEPRKCCAATAIDPLETVFSYGHRGASKSAIDAINFLKRENGIVGGLGAWNDAPERTLEDVLAAYDKAIGAAEALETP